MTLLPNAGLFRMIRNGRLDPDLVVDYLRRRDPALPQARAREITDARIRIFNSYRRTVRQELHGFSSTRIRTQD